MARRGPGEHDLPRLSAVKSHHYSRHAGELKLALKDAVPHGVLKALHERRALRHFLVLGRQLLLLAAATAALGWGPWWLWPPALLLQGFTIFNFTVLLHEVVHHAVFDRRRPLAERVLGLCYALPSGISATQFTRWHLDHHQELGSPTDDPKRFHLSPKRNARWYKALYMTPALFFIYFRAAARETATYPADVRRVIRRERLAAVALHLSILGGLLAWDPAAALRIHAIPVFLVFPVAFTLNRIGQHYWVDPSRPEQWSTLVKSHPFWNLLFLNSNFHLEHHYFPGVPLYRLHVLHRELQPFYSQRDMRAHGYGELLWHWFVLNKPPHANWDEPAAIAEPVEA
jgi:beta-carotene hydroxylase